jgi:glutathione S-transferase
VIKENPMKLYFAPDACSLSPHIVLRELGVPFELVKVDTKTKKTATGGDFLAVNPKGYVPVLELDDGERLTEGPAIVQYLADRKPDAKLAPANGTFERSRLQETLNFITSELHKSYSPLFNSAMPDEAKALFKDKLTQRYAHVDQLLAQHAFVTGAQFSVADAYLFTVTRWAKFVGLDLSRFAALNSYMQRVEARPSVQAALEAEGKAKKNA